MAFCSSCGAKMEDGVKFCPSCGTPAGGGASVTTIPASPVMEKIGNIRKCPSCGAEVPSMTAVCPDCGHEFNSVKVSDAVQKFVAQINEIDAEIARKKSTGISGWNVWRTAKKIGWVILNIYTLAIPLIVSTVKKLSGKNPPLTPLEQKKKELIENFIVPNNREDIMEFVLFSSSKIESQMPGSGAALDEIGPAHMWAKIWADKCKQLSTKASIVLAGDTTTLTTINTLMDKPQQAIVAAKKKMLIRNLSLVAVIIIVAGVILINVSGVTIKVPKSTVIAADMVTIGGDFDDYYEAVGNGFEIKSREGGKELSVSGEIRSMKAIMPDINKQITDFIKEQGWKASDCSINLEAGYSYSSFISINGFTIEGSLGDFKLDKSVTESIIYSLLKMQPEETQKINMTLVADKNTSGGKKKMHAKLMNKDDLQLNFTLVYTVKNNTTGKSERVIIK
jgi:predicted RNA-binding Zn-ribbon protein involved in translation (DUF1610 family)